ncbi:putative DNA polymerase I [Burkholderia phage vB_BpP_HN04]|nr:DNA polymerase I DNA polymerase I [Burkholderia phage vB_BpP_HN01]
MRHLVFEQNDQYPVCLLVQQINEDAIRKEYLDPHPDISPADVLVLDLHTYPGKKKVPKAEIVQYITEMLVPVWQEQKCQYIMCSDPEYFKALTGEAKADANLGYALPCVYMEDVKVVYIPNYKAVFYDPEKVRSKITIAVETLIASARGQYQAPGVGIIQQAHYPKTLGEIQEWLRKLLDMNVPLTVDIEAFSLKHYDAGIGTITFCWSKSEGIAFPVDYVPIHGAASAPYGRQVRNEEIRSLLRWFFEECSQRMIYHNIAYDVYALIFQLYMDDITDNVGLLRGLSVMLKNWDCTKLITYLATNSCSGNKLGLKDQSQEYTGNYAQEDIHDITLIPLDQLLQYNLIDGLATWFVYEKHWGTLVADDQEDVYLNVFKPATTDIIQMQLTGMPINMPRVLEVEVALTAVMNDALARMNQTEAMQKFAYRLKEKYIEKKHKEWKVKRITLAEVPDDVVFNPRSPLQVQDLLYGMLGLPVISFTDSKQPSVDADTIGKLKNHTKDADTLALLDALLDFAAVDKIVGSFIPAMKNAQQGADGWWYLFGNFNLGGTLSGRLSSSNPNLQNLPSNVAMAISDALLAMFDILKQYTKKGKLSLGKLIKYCFQPPPGWLFVGLDFASLEDRISALTTKDPMKLKVYIDGFDGHCLRAYAYFGDQMPDIDPNSVESINSIAEKYKVLRQDSKAPTFALTYQGTWSTLVKNCGFSPEVAKAIEARYHALYEVSDQWVQSKLDVAAKVGYVTAAFGLRVRTPLLKQVIRGTSKTPHEAEAEGRSAGNALGQSWCLLNSRAGSEFMGKVRESEFRNAIRPCAQIHDAQYFIIKDDIAPVSFTNKHLVDAVFWQEHPDIQHDTVKLGGEVSIFHPDWSEEIVIPNYLQGQEIFDFIDKEAA